MSTPSSFFPHIYVSKDFLKADKSQCTKLLYTYTDTLLQYDNRGTKGRHRNEILQRIQILNRLVTTPSFRPESLVFSVFTPTGNGWYKSEKNLVKEIDVVFYEGFFRIYSLFFEKLGFPPPQNHGNEYKLIFKIPHTKFTPDLRKVALCVERFSSEYSFKIHLKRIKGKSEDELLPWEKSTLLILELAKAAFKEFYYELKGKHKPALSTS